MDESSCHINYGRMPIYLKVNVCVRSSRNKFHYDAVLYQSPQRSIKFNMLPSRLPLFLLLHFIHLFNVSICDSFDPSLGGRPMGRRGKVAMATKRAHALPRNIDNEIAFDSCQCKVDQGKEGILVCFRLVLMRPTCSR